VGRKNSGTVQKLLFLILVCAAGVAVWMAGCDKIARSSAPRQKLNLRKKNVRFAARRALLFPGRNWRLFWMILGNHREAAEAVFALHYPLTISVLPYHTRSTEIAGGGAALRTGSDAASADAGDCE